MKIALIAAGDMKDFDFYKELLKDANLIICIDGGSNHLYRLEMNPDLIIGDLDSIKPEVKDHYMKQGIEFKKFPRKKDKTDTEIAIEYAYSLNPSEVILLGAIGSRLDHSLTNINLLYNYYNKDIVLKLINENNEVVLITDSISLTGDAGDTVSLVPLNGDVTGVCLEGLEYPLGDATIRFGSSLGVSNVMTKGTCNVSIKTGYLLVIKSHD